MGFLGNKLQTILMYFEMILTKLILYLCNIMGWEGCTRLAEIEMYWIYVSAKVYYFVLSSKYDIDILKWFKTSSKRNVLNFETHISYIGCNFFFFFESYIGCNYIKISKYQNRMLSSVSSIRQPKLNATYT